MSEDFRRSRWIDNWPVEVYKSVRAYEVFQWDDRYKERCYKKVNHVTLAFNYSMVSQEFMDDFGLDEKIFQLDNMLDFLENYEKRFLIKILPIKVPGDEAIFLKDEGKIGENGKPIFLRVTDEEIEKALLSLSDSDKVVMTTRREWEVERFYNDYMHWPANKYRRRLGFGVVPKSAKIVKENG